jgi:hypothetical protein
MTVHLQNPANRDYKTSRHQARQYAIKTEATIPIDPGTLFLLMAHEIVGGVPENRPTSHLPAIGAPWGRDCGGFSSAVSSHESCFPPKQAGPTKPGSSGLTSQHHAASVLKGSLELLRAPR